MSSQGLDDIPTKAIDINPTTCDPAWLWPAQECRQRLIVELPDRETVLREIDDGNSARGAQCRHGGMATVRFARIYTWLGAGYRKSPMLVRRGQGDRAGVGICVRCQPGWAVNSS
jgi:hypothetical protein